MTCKRCGYPRDAHILLDGTFAFSCARVCPTAVFQPEEIPIEKPVEPTAPVHEDALPTDALCTVAAGHISYLLAHIRSNSGQLTGDEVAAAERTVKRLREAASYYNTQPEGR